MVQKVLEFKDSKVATWELKSSNWRKILVNKGLYKLDH